VGAFVYFCNMIISSVSDLKLVARSATNRIVFYDSNDRPIVGIKVTDQVQVSYTDSQLVIINNADQVYRFTIYALYDIDGKGFTPIDNDSYSIEDYQQKLQEAFEWLQTVVLVSCCDGGDSPLELRFYPDLASFPVPGTSGLLYIDEGANTIYRWDAPNYVMLGGGGGGLEQATASGTDTYTATITGVASYADGDAYLIRFTNGNTTGCTLNINGLGARTLYRNNDGALIGGDIVSGAEMLCIYNTVINGFQVIGTAPNTLLAYVTNDDSVTITKGQVVYAFGGQGDRMTVKRAANTADSTSAQTVGLVLSTSIAANQKGLIMMQGLLDGLSILPTATYSDGDPIYLGATPGSITKVKPYAPNHLVYLGVVTTANNGSAGRMYVKVQNGYELDELHNVQAQTPAYKDTLWYDNTVSPPQWKTASLATILGYTPVPDTRNITINGTTQDLSADRTWTVGNVDLSVLSATTANQRENDWTPAGWPGSVIKVIDITSTHTQNVLFLSGLTNGVTGRIVIIRNVSSNNLIVLENNCPLSSAGNRFAFTALGTAVFLLPGRSCTVMHDGSFWRQIENYANPYLADLCDEFLSLNPNTTAPLSSQHYAFFGAGAGAGVRQQSDGATFGGAEMLTGTTAGGSNRSGMGMRGAGPYFGSAANRIAVLINKIDPINTPTAAQDFCFLAGFDTNALATPTSNVRLGYFWRLPQTVEPTNTGFWQNLTVNTSGSLVSVVNSPIAYSTSSIYTAIYLSDTDNGGSATYLYSTNGVEWVFSSKFAHTASGGYSGAPGMYILKNAGTTSVSVRMDHSALIYNTNR
jgi:hypothetical protein